MKKKFRYCESLKCASIRITLQIILVLLTFSELNQDILFAKSTSQKTIADSSTTNDITIKNDLEIELETLKTEFIQGESIDILVKMKNNTDSTIRTGSPRQFLRMIKLDSTFINKYGHAILDISPQGNFYYMIDLQKFSAFNFNPRFLYEGEFEYHIAQFVGEKVYFSDTIKIKINSAPDSLINALSEYDKKRTLEELELVVKKYRGTFFEQKYLAKLFSSWPYLENIVGSKKDVYKEFIIAYPNSASADYFFNQIINKESDELLLSAEIINYLNDNNPSCNLLKVLKNQPEYFNKRIKHLLK